MRQIEINPKEAFSELQALQAKERTRLINEALTENDLAPAQRKRLALELEYSTKFVDGEMVPIDTDGQPLTDAHGWPLSATEFIKQTATSLFSTSPEAQQVKVPASGEELFHAMRGAKSDAERQEIYKLYKGQ